MTEKTKSLLSIQKNPNLRYSQSSSNSTENSEFDYNLYCFSQGYQNHEKGYWRGVLRNKYIDFDLRLNKDWTRRIEIEADALEKLDTQSQLSKKFENEYIAFINDNELGWDSDRFQNFKKKQLQTGAKKQKNKEWLLSNGVKRTSAAVELRTQSFKQFEENEKNKELKKASLSDISKQIEEKYGVQAGKPLDYSDKNRTAEKFQKTFKTATDTYNDYNNTYNTLTSSANINEQKRGFGPGSIKKRIDSSFTGEKPDSHYTNRNLGKDFNYSQYQRQKTDQNIGASGKDKKQGFLSQTQTSIDLDKYKRGTFDQKYGKVSPKGSEKGGYGTYSFGKDGQEFKYGQKGTYSDQKSYLMPGTNEQGRMGSYDKYGKPSTKERPKIQPFTFGKSAYDKTKPKEALQTDYTKSKLQQTPQKSSQMSFMKTFQQGKQPSSQYGQPSYGKEQPKIDYSKYMKTQSYTDKKGGAKVDDKFKKPSGVKQFDYMGKGGKPTEIRKQSTYNLGKKTQLGKGDFIIQETSLDRPANIGRLEVSVEKKKKEKVERKPRSRTHERLCSSKKRKLSYDKDGKPLKNTARLNVSTEKKKPPRERLNNISRLEISEERKKKEKPQRKPGSRKHERIHSSKKKRKVSLDKYGKPLTNTARLNVSTEKKKPPRERLDNLSKLEISVEGKKKPKPERKPGSRKHERIHSSKKKRKISYDSEGNPLTNISRLKVGYEGDKIKYMEKDDNYRSQNLDRYNSFKTKSDFGEKKYPTTYKTKQGIQTYQKGQKPQDQRTPSRKPVGTGYSYPAYPVSEKKEIGGKGQIQKYQTSSNFQKMQSSATYQRNKPYGIAPNYQQYTYDSRTQQQPGYIKGSNISYGISSSQLNTAATNKYGKPGRMNKSVDASDDFLFKDKKPYGQSSTVASEKKRYVAPGQKAYSLPKKLVSDKKGQKQAKKPTDSVKIDLSKYLPKQTPTKGQKYTKPSGKDSEPEIYEYYPLSKTDQKGKALQISKQGKTPSFTSGSKYQTKTAKKDTKSPRISDYDVYEYNPKTQNNFYDYNKPSYGIKGDKGKQGQYLNNRYQVHSPSSDETKKGQRSKSIQNVFAPTSGSYKGAMAFFKLQFLTTKQVCEKFWKSIDNGELSASMFDAVRSSGTASKLGNYLSPSKNSYSNENTDFSGKFSKNGGLNNKFGLKAFGSFTNQNYLKNNKQTYKAGYY